MDVPMIQFLHSNTLPLLLTLLTNACFVGSNPFDHASFVDNIADHVCISYLMLERYSRYKNQIVIDAGEDANTKSKRLDPMTNGDLCAKSIVYSGYITMAIVSYYSYNVIQIVAITY
eukprot:129091_1